METPRKMGNQQLVSAYRQRFGTAPGFVQGSFTKKPRDNTGASAILFWPGFAWFLPVPSTEISNGGTARSWCYWHHLKCVGRAEKALTRWLPGMFQTPFQLLAEMYSCTRGLFWRKCSLNDCTVSYFSEIKWSRENFKATTYSKDRNIH